MDNYFVALNDIDVSDRTEKKGSLTYLSWAWAWGELKRRHPDATYTIYEDAQGRNYHTDGRTCWVKTGVTVGGLEHIEYLPVMDNRNFSITLDKVVSTDINKAIQRSLTKAVARHGLGLYIYAGEDLPESKRPEPEEIAPNINDQISQMYLTVIGKLIDRKGWSMEKCEAYCQKKWGNALGQLTMGEGALLIKMLEAKPDATG